MPEQKTVMIADDERSMRLLIRASLGSATYRFLEASSGPEALDLARRERPDLLLLDVGLPGLDGYAICRALKAERETAELKVIMITARARDTDRDEALSAGADGYVVKPFSPAVLQSDLRGYLA